MQTSRATRELHKIIIILKHSVLFLNFLSVVTILFGTTLFVESPREVSYVHRQLQHSCSLHCVCVYMQCCVRTTDEYFIHEGTKKKDWGEFIFILVFVDLCYTSRSTPHSVHRQYFFSVFFSAHAMLVPRLVFNTLAAMSVKTTTMRVEWFGLRGTYSLRASESTMMARIVHKLPKYCTYRAVFFNIAYELTFILPIYSLMDGKAELAFSAAIRSSALHWPKKRFFKFTQQQATKTT